LFIQRQYQFESAPVDTETVYTQLYANAAVTHTHARYDTSTLRFNLVNRFDFRRVGCSCINDDDDDDGFIYTETGCPRVYDAEQSCPGRWRLPRHDSDENVQIHGLAAYVSEQTTRLRHIRFARDTRARVENLKKK